MIKLVSVMQSCLTSHALCNVAQPRRFLLFLLLLLPLASSITSFSENPKPPVLLASLASDISSSFPNDDDNDDGNDDDGNDDDGNDDDTFEFSYSFLYVTNTHS